MKTARFFLIIGILASCSSPQKEQPKGKAVPKLASTAEREIISFLSKPLPKKELPDSIRQILEKNLSLAKERSEANPDSLNLVIWYGRRIAYLGRYFEAIDIYTEGLEQFSNSYRLLRHRGYRYISTQQLVMAIANSTPTP